MGSRVEQVPEKLRQAMGISSFPLLVSALDLAERLQGVLGRLIGLLDHVDNLLEPGCSR